MAVVADVLAAADAEYAPLRPNIAQFQQNFRAQNPRFWQGLRTHQVTPADGVAAPVDPVIGLPSDETVPWPANVRTLSTVQSYEVYKYQAPAGHGFLILRRVVINGELYLAIEDVGGYVGSEDWHVLAPELP